MNPKLLLLHGALGSKKQFAPLKQLLNQFFEVYDLSFEGHGGVVSNQSFSLNLFTNNVVDFMREQQLENVNIFGYKHGWLCCFKYSPFIS